MENAAADIPGAFGAPPSNLHTGRNSQYKLFEWAAFLHWFSIPMLVSMGAPQEVTKHWSLLVHAVSLILDRNGISEENLNLVQQMLHTFVVDFEKMYVQGELSLVHRCKLYIFQLLHVTTQIRLNGTFRLGSQFSMERTIGYFKRLIRSSKAPFVDLANCMIKQETLTVLALLYPEFTTDVMAKAGVPGFYAKIAQSSVVIGAPLQPWNIERPTHMQLQARQALSSFIFGATHNPPILIDHWTCYGKVTLPGGLCICSASSEHNFCGDTRHACRVQVCSINTYLVHLTSLTIQLSTSYQTYTLDSLLKSSILFKFLH